jgi:hypothetical protein
VSDKCDESPGEERGQAHHKNGEGVLGNNAVDAGKVGGGWGERGRGGRGAGVCTTSVMGASLGDHDNTLLEGTTMTFQHQQSAGRNVYQATEVVQAASGILHIAR